MWNDTMSKDGEREGDLPARVIAKQRNGWRIAGEFGECVAEPSGKLRRAADEEGADWPSVGDWLVVELQPSGDLVVARAVLPRQNRFTRKAPGKKIEEQVIAANVDTALVVSALDGDFNPRRAERYIAQCWESGVRPVLLLNKADACEDARARAAEMERVALGAAVFVVSGKTGDGLTEIEPLLKPGQTLVMLGSSGVGKSTLTNRLLGQSVQATNEVRAGDCRGRHTTTTRELFALPCGALLIDTPGLRELHLWGADEGLAQAFGDIESLASALPVQRLRSRNGTGLRGTRGCGGRIARRRTPRKSAQASPRAGIFAPQSRSRIPRRREEAREAPHDRRPRNL